MYFSLASWVFSCVRFSCFSICVSSSLLFFFLFFFFLFSSLFFSLFFSPLFFSLLFSTLHLLHSSSSLFFFSFSLSLSLSFLFVFLSSVIMGHTQRRNSKATSTDRVCVRQGVTMYYYREDLPSTSTTSGTQMSWIPRQEMDQFQGEETSREEDKQCSSQWTRWRNENGMGNSMRSDDTKDCAIQEYLETLLECTLV